MCEEEVLNVGDMKIKIVALSAGDMKIKIVALTVSEKRQYYGCFRNKNCAL